MTEREWREASDMRPSRLGIALVVVAAASLRFWGLGSGIPYAVGVDEPVIIDNVVRMMKTGDLHPHFFDYPTLYFYVQLVVACARFLTGAMLGLWTSLNQVSSADFYLWGRAVTAIFGTATVLLVYFIGLRWGTRHALLGAGLMAVMSNHVRESHYVLTDVPLTFFTTLAFLLALRAHEKADVKSFAWAGAAVGLAAATKYNGALALVLPIAAAWMTLDAKPSRLRCSLATVAAAIVGFLVFAPYTILDLPEFLNSFARLAAYYRPRRFEAEAGWIIYAKHLRTSLYLPALLLTAVGVGLSCLRIARGPNRARWMLLLGFPVLHFWVISRQSLIFARYMLPILPFVSLMVAVGVVSGVSLLRRFEFPRAVRTALIAALTMAVLVPPAWNGINFVRNMTKQSTQALTYAWVTRHIPPGSKIAIEGFSFRLPEKRYTTEHVRTLVERRQDDYVAADIEYLIASSQTFGPVFEMPQDQPAKYAAYRTLFDQSKVLVVIKPSDDHPGPEFRIYRVGG